MAAVPLHLAKTKLCLFTVNSGAAVDLPGLVMSCLVLLFFVPEKFAFFDCFYLFHL